MRGFRQWRTPTRRNAPRLSRSAARNSQARSSGLSGFLVAAFARTRASARIPAFWRTRLRQLIPGKTLTRRLGRNSPALPVPDDHRESRSPQASTETKKTPTEYDRLVHWARIVTAIAFAVSGLGIVVSLESADPESFWLFGIGAALSLAMVALLVVEQFVTAWRARRRRNISLAALLLLTLVCSVFFAVMRNSFSLALLLLLVALVIFSACLEGKRDS